MTLPLGTVSLTPRQIALVNEALCANRLSYGPMTRALEGCLAQLHGVSHAVFLASGTCALQVGLEAAKERYGWRDGSEVIVPATTFIATVSSVLQAGLVPVLADVDYTGNLAPNQIDQHVNGRTVAVMPVHLLGRAADMGAICAEAKRLSLAVLEDCCEAVGVRFNGKPVGSFGLFGAVSTYVCHHVSTGVGGAVLTNDADLAKLCRSLLQHGRDPGYLCLEDDDRLDDAAVSGMMRARYSFVRWGHSYRATELEAAIGVGALEQPISGRQEAAQQISAVLAPYSEWVTPAEFGPEDSPLFYPLVCRNAETCQTLSEAFERAGIETRPMMPLLTQPIVLSLLERQGKTVADYPIAWDLCQRAFLIGCHAGVGNAQLRLIQNTTEKVLGPRMPRRFVPVEDPALWSQAWCAQSCADEQFALASRELKEWLEGKQHPAFDAYREMLRRCERVGSVLEIGCGAGYYQWVTSQCLPGVDYTGCDISEAMIAIAEREYKPGIFLESAAESLPLVDAAFDLVVLGSVLGCCDDWQKAVHEAFRVSGRYVMLHRVAVHDRTDLPEVRDSVKEAYGVKMAERIVRDEVLLAECQGARIGEPIVWSRTEDGFQASYLFEKGEA